jgi:hypothetical protein
MLSTTTQLEITYLRTTLLKPNPRNPRVHTDKQVRQIAGGYSTASSAANDADDYTRFLENGVFGNYGSNFPKSRLCGHHQANSFIDETLGSAADSLTATV